MIVDNTILTAVAECSTKAAVRYVLHLTKPGGSLPARAGSAGHVAMEKHFLGLDIGSVTAAFSEAYRNTIRPEEVDDERWSRENLVDILDGWAKEHPLDAFPFTVETVEQGVRAEIADGVEFFGKIDMQVRDAVSMALGPCDHKFTGQNLTSWWGRKWRYGSQLTGYIWLVERNTGVEVSQAYVNAVKVKELPKSSTKCKVHKVPYFECRHQHIENALLVTTRTREALAEWQRTAVSLVGKFKELQNMVGHVAHAVLLRQQGSFNGACVFCEFADWCAAGRPVEMAEAGFVVEPWAPWEEGRNGSQ